MAERYGAGHERYGDWRSLELAIKDAAKKAARHAGPGISAASIDAQIRQARFDRFLCRVFAEGEQSARGVPGRVEERFCRALSQSAQIWSDRSMSAVV